MLHPSRNGANTKAHITSASFQPWLLCKHPTLELYLLPLRFIFCMLLERNSSGNGTASEHKSTNDRCRVPAVSVLRACSAVSTLALSKTWKDSGKHCSSRLREAQCLPNQDILRRIPTSRDTQVFPPALKWQQQRTSKMSSYNNRANLQSQNQNRQQHSCYWQLEELSTRRSEPKLKKHVCCNPCCLMDHS